MYPLSTAITENINSQSFGRISHGEKEGTPRSAATENWNFDLKELFQSEGLIEIELGS